MKFKIAVGSRDGKAVNEHFGSCKRFIILTVDEEKATYQFDSYRDVEPPCDGAEHTETGLDKVAKALSDCRIVLVERIGTPAQLALEQYGIDVLEYYGLIEDALKTIIHYYK
jgi:nitrogen fixation protein NifX